MKYTKMHGLGNDFIIFCHSASEELTNYEAVAKRLCNRNMGIGADGILVVLPSSKADIRMRIINSDGSEANMCGNGIRCFAKYVYENNIVSKSNFEVETLAGLIKPELNIVDGKVSTIKVDMGKPILTRKEIPMIGKEGYVISEPIEVNGKEYKITSILMGVPHTMVFVDNLDEVDIESIGPKIEKHPLFPKKTNVNFIQVINNNEIKVKTWERGAGLTYACGTGSCASAVASILSKKTGRDVMVHLKVGDLYIQWTDEESVYMIGPAEEVFTCVIV